ncbi:MAG: hypothetical protein U0931_08340 [Vulcanimicrobiota bacterium]
MLLNSTQACRQQQWTRKLEELKSTADGLGLGLDEPIVDTVAALQLNGFNTRQSCGGHLDHGCSVPWVDIQAENRPPFLFERPEFMGLLCRYQGQEEIYRQVAQERGLSLEEMMSRRRTDEAVSACQEAQTRSAAQPETSEFKRWAQENHELFRKFERVVTTFNQQQHLSGPDRIQLSEFGSQDGFRISLGEEVDRKAHAFCTPEEVAVRQPHTEPAREIMRSFAGYLKKTFITQGPING